MAGANDSAHLPQKDSTGPGYDGTWNAPTGIVTNNENLPLVMDMGFLVHPREVEIIIPGFNLIYEPQNGM